MRNFIQRGDAPDVVFPIAVKSSDGVLIGPGLFGVAANDQAEGSTGPLAVYGVFELPKAAGEVTPGAKAYWDNAAKKLTSTAGGNTYVGAFPTGAAGASPTAAVRLHGAPV